MVKAAVVSLFVTWITFGQATAQEKFKLTGNAVNSVTGAPVNRALVTLSGTASRSAFSGADGHFEFAELPEGTYYLTAERPGFVGLELATGTEGAVSPGQAAFQLAAKTPPQLLKLLPAAVIVGRIADRDGEPISDVAVTCFRNMIQGGLRQWMHASGTTTGSQGTFRIEGLQPGDYLLKVEQKPLYRTGAPNITFVYPSQYYPSGRLRSSAQVIHLAAGAKGSATFQLSAVASYSVSGAVSPATASGMVRVTGEDGEDESNGEFAEGHFEIFYVPKGIVHLSFVGQNAAAEQTVDVKGSSVSNIAVALQPLGDIPLRVGGDDKGENLAQQLVHLVKVNDTRQQYYPQLDASSGSVTATFRGLQPGDYRAVTPVNGQACVTGVRSGNIDLLRETLRIEPGGAPAPIRVELSDDCGGVSGKVTSQHSQQTLILYAREPFSQEPGIAVSGSNGNFEIANLPPGDYRLYAFSSIEGLEYANPDALRSYDGQSIHIGAKQHVTVNLNQNTVEAQ